MSFREWRSSDDGATWTSVGVIQTSPGADGDGIWEPFVGLDSSGNMVMYFSDERQNATYSQFLGHMISTDGGDTWSANLDLAPPSSSTRRGQGRRQHQPSPTVPAWPPSPGSVRPANT